jgi:DNA-binding transcriptional regulator YdaS (Cro superfamily)
MRRGRKALERAIQVAGGQSALAAALGVRQSHIWHWLHKSQHGVPAERVADVERVTGIARQELRPDLYQEQGPPAGFSESSASDMPMSTSNTEADRSSRRDSGHFSRFKHLRRAHFNSSEEIAGHIRALREEWDRR